MEPLKHSQRPIADILAETQEATPRLLGLLRAANGDEQKRLFLSGAIENPELEYDALGATDFAAIDVRLGELGGELVAHSDVDHHFMPSYSDFIAVRRQQAQLLGALQTYHSAPSGSQAHAEAASEYQLLNESLYGQVDKETFYSLLSGKLRSFRPDADDTTAEQILGEVKAMVPSEALAGLPAPYTVPAETFAAVQTMAKALFGNLLRHVPDRDEAYDSAEITSILAKIIHEEFGDSTTGWVVRQNKQTGLSVAPLEREVHVSPTITADGPKLRWLVAHEVGVHVMRAVRGAESDLLPFAIGMAGYDAAEEGLGMALQQATKGKFEMAGEKHYTTAGLLNGGRDFRQTFEVNWRLAALEALKPGEQLTDEAITKARETGYSRTMRLYRGAGPTAFLRDLSYYNGAKAMWQYFEHYGADELMLNLALLGKHDPTQHTHLQAALETRTY